MGGQFGIEELKKSVVCVAEVVNVVDKLLNKGGLGVLFGLITPINVLKALNLEQLKKEISELDEAERHEVQAAFKAQLKLVKPDVQAKIEGGIGHVEKAIGLVNKGIGLFNEGKGFVEEVKLFFN